MDGLDLVPCGEGTQISYGVMHKKALYLECRCMSISMFISLCMCMCMKERELYLDGPSIRDELPPACYPPLQAVPQLLQAHWVMVQIGNMEDSSASTQVTEECATWSLIWPCISPSQALFTDPALRAGSVIESPCPSICAIGCSFFRGLSLALRSHDQFQASHWSSLPSPFGNLETRKLVNSETR